MLHMASYAAPTTVYYIFRKPAIIPLVDQRAHYNEDGQWGLFHYNTPMGEQKWIAVRSDRNRHPYLWMKVTHPHQLQGLVSVKFEGKGIQLDEKSQSDWDTAQIGSRSEKPDRAPLHYAAEAGNASLAEALQAKGADVNMRDYFGMTPMHTAAKCDNEEVAEVLCSHGADLTLLDNTNSTALQVALDNGHLHKLVWECIPSCIYCRRVFH